MTTDHDPFDSLDSRAGEARRSLHDHVSSIDLADARSSLAGRARRQRRDRMRARGAALGVVVSAIVVGAAVLSVGQGATNDNRDPDREIAVDDSREQDLLENLPSSPIDGKDSWRLPVGVNPQVGLNDGDLVTIFGRGFEPDEALGVVMCSAEADTHNAGISACELGENGGYSSVQYVSADSEGTVMAQVQVRRFITTPMGGRIDCASVAERCLLGMGAISNYDRSGGVYVTFSGSPELMVPAVSLSDPGTVQVTGWVPERMVRIQQCAPGEDGFGDNDPCLTLADAPADTTGSLTVPVTLTRTFIIDGTEVVCDPCVLRATGLGVSIGSTAPVPEPIPVPEEALASDAPPATEPPPTTAPPIDAPSTSSTTTAATTASTTAATETTLDPTTTAGR